MKIDQIADRAHALRATLEMCRTRGWTRISRSYNQLCALPNGVPANGPIVFILGDAGTPPAPTSEASLDDIAAAYALATSAAEAHKQFETYHAKHNRSRLDALTAAHNDATRTASLHEPGTLYPLSKLLEAAVCGLLIEKVYERRAAAKKRPSRAASAALRGRT